MFIRACLGRSSSLPSTLLFVKGTLSRAAFELNDQNPSLERLDDSLAEEAFHAHSAGIERFLLGILRDPVVAADIVQTTFVRLIEKGGGVASESRRAWLFKVAYNEAMLTLRRGAVSRKAGQELGWRIRAKEKASARDGSIHSIVQAEDAAQVRKALSQLSPELRLIVRLRVYEGLKFAEIAERLNMPLGTVLTRMRNSLSKLRMKLNELR